MKSNGRRHLDINFGDPSSVVKESAGKWIEVLYIHRLPGIKAIEEMDDGDTKEAMMQGYATAVADVVLAMSFKILEFKGVIHIPRKRKD